MALEPTTNFKDSNNVDLGRKLVTKDYLISVYPGIGDKIGIPPELWVWGHGTYGELGNAQIIDKSTPVTTFAGGTNWKQVSSAYYTTSAIKTDGTLWIWGRTAYGILGNAISLFGSTCSTPITTFAGGNNWRQVSCSRRHTAAIKTDGTLWIWGNGTYGRLGNGVTTGLISTPITTFAGGNNWRQVSTGSRYTSAIKTDGTLWTWGGGGGGQLGNATFAFEISTPITTFAGGTNWKQVSSERTSFGGNNTTVAIKTDGTLWTWGNGFAGKLGNAGTIETSTPVTTFAGGNNWKQVSIGSFHMAAIKTDGTLWVWGNANFGQLGNAATTGFRSTPVTTFAGGANWKQVDPGYGQTAAIKTDGTLWIWGRPDYGQLGIFFTGGFRSTPVTTFAGGTNWKQVSASYQHTVAIKSVDF
jgi:alpha-tubulin suppressor-like RCC1 family protein